MLADASIGLFCIFWFGVARDRAVANLCGNDRSAEEEA